MNPFKLFILILTFICHLGAWAEEYDSKADIQSSIRAIQHQQRYLKKLKFDAHYLETFLGRARIRYQSDSKKCKDSQDCRKLVFAGYIRKVGPKLVAFSRPLNASQSQLMFDLELETSDIGVGDYFNLGLNVLSESANQVAMLMADKDAKVLYQRLKPLEKYVFAFERDLYSLRGKIDQQLEILKQQLEMKLFLLEAN